MEFLRVRCFKISTFGCRAGANFRREQVPPRSLSRCPTVTTRNKRLIAHSPVALHKSPKPPVNPSTDREIAATTLVR